MRSRTFSTLRVSLSPLKPLRRRQLVSSRPVALNQPSDQPLKTTQRVLNQQPSAAAIHTSGPQRTRTAVDTVLGAALPYRQPALWKTVCREEP
ncbi:unnamed protein product [Boreogadus saida]